MLLHRDTSWSIDPRSAVERSPEQAQLGHHHRRLGGLVHAEMKEAIEFHDRLSVGLLEDPVVEVGQLDKHAARDPVSRQPGREALEGGADEGVLLEAHGLASHDAGAAVKLADNEPFGFELPDGLAHGSGAHAEALCKLALFEDGTRLKLAAEYEPLQLSGHQIGFAHIFHRPGSSAELFSHHATDPSDIAD